MELEKRENQVPKVEVKRIVDGLGFGEGNISYLERIDQVGPVKLDAVETAINSGSLLVPVDYDPTGQQIDDDGCGDGRVWRRVFHGSTEKFRSLIRPKVFGGGVTMAMAMDVGLGKSDNDNLQSAFSMAINNMNHKGIDFGGHTDRHSEAPNCGCGAIDKAPQIIGNIARYSHEIKQTIESLGVNSDGLNEVLTNFNSFAQSSAEDKSYAGSTVMGEVLKQQKVVKELDGTHNEMFVVLNEVSGHTIDQEKVRQLSDGDIQIFVVDTWRLKDIAERLNDNDTSAVQNQAYLSALVYTLGVAATLTKGDLPVYTVNHLAKPVAA
jgi:hypothetical protein